MSRGLARLRNQSVVRALSASDCSFGGGANRALLAWRTLEALLVESTSKVTLLTADEETRLADFSLLSSGLVGGKTLLGIQRSPTLFPTMLSTQYW